MQPLVFEPYVRPQVWGNRRLADVFGKPLPASGTFGESWEISGQELHVSCVAEGPLRGTPLNDLCRSRSDELFGSETPACSRFPLLLKLLDCHDLLSIQVHPTDRLAAEFLEEECGKTEAWLVLDVAPQGRIYAGLLPGIRRSELERHLDSGTVDRCLHCFTPKVGDCVFLPAGTVHAVGGGVVLAEVQQASDATFRLFDWNRAGPDGRPRQLHKEEALAAIDWNQGPVQPVTPAAITDLPQGIRAERLVECAYFTLERYCLAGPWPLPFPRQLSIWMVLQESAELTAGDNGYRRLFRRGDTVLVPASAPDLMWNPVEDAVSLMCVRLAD
jgi:mannose-6-phosphate isomerase